MTAKEGADILPVGPLMKEHRLIERMVSLLDNPDRPSAPKSDFLEQALDFFIVYADRCHHGKEEDILFKALQSKNMSGEHRKMMAQLFEEHASARGYVLSLKDLVRRYKEGSADTAKEIASTIRKLVSLYTAHIKKEDEEFFLPVMEYLDKEERKDMLLKFEEFDRMLIHEKYKSIVGRLEGK